MKDYTRRFDIRLVLALTLYIPLRELYGLELPGIGQVFPKGVKIYPYLANPEYWEFIRWYVNDIVRNGYEFLLPFLWWLSIRDVKPGLAKLIVILWVFGGMNFIVYLLNHSHPGTLYYYVYGSIFAYIGYQTYRWKTWRILEWCYGKWQNFTKSLKRNGNGN